MSHTFHIPVLGLGYSIDTPLKVARFGISSVLSIVDDELIERVREYHTRKHNLEFISISKTSTDSRANRICTYLNFLHDLTERQFEDLRQQDFTAGSEICKYFELLPEGSNLKNGYELMMDYPEGEPKKLFQHVLRREMKPGAVDVNIMAKVDKMNYIDNKYAGDENTDALAALRGFAMSKLQSSIILSAGMNPRLYSYLTQFNDFFPDEKGKIRKKIILKVSDFRSALIQAKFLAKKGLWVSEFRIESGLNCGGHAFATEGYLLGPILSEFTLKRTVMYNELFAIYQQALNLMQIDAVAHNQRISVQGGIGTAEENNFLLKYYGLDATGWGSPFLLVPEVTNVDDQTLKALVSAGEQDFYLSHSSPLGIQFNNFKQSSIENQRLERIAKNRPGSACVKKYLCNNTEFTEHAICTASREYQRLKIRQLQSCNLNAGEYQKQFDKVTGKVCLCEGLCSSAYQKYGISKPNESKAVAICPGPNLAYFSGVYSLSEMVDHIYGRISLLGNIERPHFFVKELNLYIDYLQGELQHLCEHFSDKKKKQLDGFKTQLFNGIAYYKNLFKEIANEASGQLDEWQNQLVLSKARLEMLCVD